MYEIEKQKQLASLIKNFCEQIKKHCCYEEIANNLLIELDNEKKDKLKNYIKIIINSTEVKSETNIEDIDFKFTTEEPENNFTVEQLNDMKTILFIIFGSYELMLHKSKELKNDIRVKLVDELATYLETANRKISFKVHRVLTKLLD